MNSSKFIFFYSSILRFFFIVKTRTNLTQPETLGIDRVYNFYLNVESEISLGIWHFRSPLVKDQFYNNDADYFEKHLTSTLKNIPIIIYLHGNAFDR